MSPAVIAGLFFFWTGIVLLPIALCRALAERTLNKALAWLIGGVTVGFIAAVVAMSLNYSPPWSGWVSTIIAYALLLAVLATLALVILKPAEKKHIVTATEEDSH